MSMKFDIDVELSSIMTMMKGKSKIPQILINYNRRNIEQGKKLNVSDGWNILSRIIIIIKYF